ncbi:MAG TPA: hypothetical protein VHV51_12885 [Polyangiaceae bacterium]|jgi:hypothetical protein|nr:hypothetical protein [Polyangiaceae bacterium]
MTHREERSFSITLHLSAEFADDYDGDDDGFGWHERFQRSVKPELVTALFDVLRAQPRFQALAAPRGRDSDSALDIDLRFIVSPDR